ncbi:MAG: tetratricopeptide repeat protein [Bacteroidia bacterium]|nr:tetratricopeptide repeat protein [Bacteroidia bacterium]
MLAIISQNPANAQNNKWWEDFNNPKLHDTTRLKAIHNAASDRSASNPDSALLMAKYEFELAKKLKNNLYAGRAKGIMAIVYINEGDNTKAIELGLEGLKYLEQTNEKKHIAAAYNNTGVAYYNIGTFDKALEFAQKALSIRQTLGDKNGITASYNNIGNVYLNLSNFTGALEYYLKALQMRELIGDKYDIASSLNNIGNVYTKQSDFKKATDYYSKALKIREEIGDKDGIASCYSNIGVVYQFEKKYDKALEYYFKAIKINEELNDIFGLALTYGAIGDVYKEQSKFEQSLPYLFKSQQLCEQSGDKYGLATTYNSIAGAYNQMKKPTEANKYAQLSLKLNKEIQDIEGLRLNYQNLSIANANSNNYKDAFLYHVKYKDLTDSVFNLENTKQLSDIKTGFEVEKKEAELKIKSEAEQEKLKTISREEKKQQQIIIAAVVGILAIVLIFSFFLYKRFRLTTRQKAIIERQKHIVEEKNKEILDSITYAKRLQDAILPPDEYVKKYLPNSFIYYKPKDIVAGDFYWMEYVNNTIFIAAADSTGHGVPGAMVSVVCSNALNRSLKEFGLREPGKILDKTRELVLETFAKSSTEVKDGMDISLCAINKKDKKLFWSGAYNPLWYINNGIITEVKGDKQSIGKTDNPKPFITHEIPLDNTSTFYLFTDGFADQFGGPKGKKFKYKQLEELLVSVNGKLLDEQETTIHKAFENWKGNLEQVDDVTLIAITV